MKTINSILIANRGEIASRIIRTCRKMGIRSIAVYSDADAAAPYVREADLAVHIGESSPTASYLNAELIIKTAKEQQADAIHPGYGFLSESAEFAQQCEDQGLIFIGPNAAAIAAMGSKSEAKALMEKHGVPVIPGYSGEDQTTEVLQTSAAKIGYPVLLKASAGGGGKGMRIVHRVEELQNAIDAAKREAKSAFGNDELIIEKYIESGRHIEFQIFGDQQGNTIHLLERECSIQRRYQKIIEESPSPVMGPALRSAMGSAAVKAAKALAYDNAGTVEFIYDESESKFYFLEVNTRLQVEHPVTEMVTGLDLVQMQIESAEGRTLRVTQDQIEGEGYALEVRLYAENPADNFMPQSGRIERFEVPEVDGLRVETAVISGSEVSIWYDPMIAKLIVHGGDRMETLRKMIYTLRNLICQGITTNQAFLLSVLEQKAFQHGEYNTNFIDKLELNPASPDDYNALVATTIYRWNLRNEKRNLLRGIPSGWRNNYYEAQQSTFEINGAKRVVFYRNKGNFFEIEIDDKKSDVRLTGVNLSGVQLEIDKLKSSFNIALAGEFVHVHHETTGNHSLKIIDRFPESATTTNSGGYEAPMPSQVVKILVKPGQQVMSGDGLIVLSSMKMENTIAASESGLVEEIYAREGSNVEAGFTLLKMVPK